jgi:hypothetical protein
MTDSNPKSVKTNFLSRSLLFFLIALAGGCVSTSTRLDAMNRHWRGHHVDEFFAQYGLPADAYKIHDGGCLYAWNSEIKPIEMPSYAKTEGNATPTGLIGAAKTALGVMTKRGCVLQIQTAKDESIMVIRLKRESIWTSFRFRKVFSGER